MATHIHIHRAVRDAEGTKHDPKNGQFTGGGGGSGGGSAHEKRLAAGRASRPSGVDPETGKNHGPLKKEIRAVGSSHHRLKAFQKANSAGGSAKHIAMHRAGESRKKAQWLERQHGEIKQIEARAKAKDPREGDAERLAELKHRVSTVKP